MKKILVSVALVAASFAGMAQVGVGTTTPEGALDVVSANSGLIVPRVASTAAVTSPVNGMLVYDLASNCLKTYENGAWSGCLSSGGATASLENDCNADGFAFTGTPRRGIALAGGSFSVTLNNNSFATTTISFAASDLVLSGNTAGLTVGAPSPSTVTLIAGESQQISYPITGTPTAAGDVTATWTKLSLTCTQTQAIANGEAVFAAMPSIDPVHSITGTAVQGVIDNADNQITVNVPYTGGSGSYDAYSFTIPGIVGEGGDTNDITMSYPAGTFSASGDILVTFTVDGDGSFNVPKQPYGAVSTITGYTSAFNFKVNGVSQGSLYLEAQGGIYDGSTYVYLPVTHNGKTWLNNNLGANYADKNHANFAPGTQATASNDADAYGGLYQWGRGSDGHESRTSGTTSTRSAGDDPGHGDYILSANDWRATYNAALWQGVNGTNNPCPTGYRVPTEAEYTQLGFTNASTALNSALKLPLSGDRNKGDGSVVHEGSYGFYWSSTPSNANARGYVFYSSTSLTATYNRAEGFAVRCIKD